MAKVQDVGKYLRLLEAEVFLLLKSVTEDTQLCIGEHGADLLLLHRLSPLCRNGCFSSGAAGIIRAVLH